MICESCPEAKQTKGKCASAVLTWRNDKRNLFTVPTDQFDIDAVLAT